MGSIIQPQFGYDKPALWNIWNKTCYYVGYYDEDEIANKYFNLISEIYESKEKNFSGWEQVYRSLNALEILGKQSNISEASMDIMNIATFLTYTQFIEYDSDSFYSSARDFVNVADSMNFLESETKQGQSLIASLDLCNIYDQYKSPIYHVFRDAHMIWLAYPPEAYGYIIQKQRMEFLGSEEEWFVYRDDCIRNLLESDFLFHTDFCFHLYSEAAETNLVEELKSLTKEFS
jgi:predicted metal-dependent HD superfamily phosphohydrolase